MATRFHRFAAIATWRKTPSVPHPVSSREADSPQRQLGVAFTASRLAVSNVTPSMS